MKLNRKETKENLNRVRSLLRKPPSIEGIDSNLQLSSRREAIALKARQILGANLDFDGYKRLLLSNKYHLSKSSDPNDEVFKIDENVQALAAAINEKPYAVTVGACSGHLHMVDGQPELDDNGFLGFEVDPSSKEPEKLLRKIQMLCDAYTERSLGCTYSLKKTETGSYLISWSWNNPAYQAERELIDKFIASSEKDHNEFSKKLAELKAAKKIASKIAHKKHVIDEYNSFTKALAEELKSL